MSEKVAIEPVHFADLYRQLVINVEKSPTTFLAINRSQMGRYNTDTKTLEIIRRSRGKPPAVIATFYLSTDPNKVQPALGASMVPDGFEHEVYDIFVQLLKLVEPEPECFNIEHPRASVVPDVPKRFIRREWINWFLHKNPHLNEWTAFTQASKRIIAHEFADLDQLNKEAVLSPTAQLASEEDVEIFIYHVVKTRV